MDGYNHNPRAGKKRIFGQSSCFRGGVIDLAFALTFQITKCICQNCQVYLLKLPHVFVYPLPNPWRNWNRLTHRAENENMDPPIWMGIGYNHNPRAGKQRFLDTVPASGERWPDLYWKYFFQIVKCICPNWHVFVSPLPNPRGNWNRFTA